MRLFFGNERSEVGDEKKALPQLQSGSKYFGTLVKFWAKSREFTVHASIVI